MFSLSLFHGVNKSCWISYFLSIDKLSIVKSSLCCFADDINFVAETTYHHQFWATLVKFHNNIISYREWRVLKNQKQLLFMSLFSFPRSHTKTSTVFETSCRALLSEFLILFLPANVGKVSISLQTMYARKTLKCLQNSTLFHHKNHRTYCQLTFIIRAFNFKWKWFSFHSQM